MPETTIPNDNVLYELKEREVTYKLIKVFTNDNDASDTDETYDFKSKGVTNDRSHTQLFYNTTDRSSLSTCKPSYCRDVCRPNKKIDNLYWYNYALKSVASNSPIWTIDQVEVKRSKLFGKVKRPRMFSIFNPQLGSESVFEYGSSENEPKGYSGEVSTPFDQSSVQRYRWVRYKDGSRWAFIARNDPNTPLVELRKTSYENEFDIVFLESSPPGWNLRNITRQTPDLVNVNQTAEFAGRYPSVFSNPSTYRSSTTSGFLSNRESTFSDVSSRAGSEGDKNSRLYSTYSENKFTFSKKSTKVDSKVLNSEVTDPERYWQEFVLASTVTIQDEVNSSKRRLWKYKTE